MRESIEGRIALGRVIAQRVPKARLPASLSADTKTFSAQQTKVDAQQGVVEAEESAYHEALKKVGEHDEKRDELLDAIATALVGAGLAKRNAPFGGFSSYSPTNMARLPYAAESIEIEAFLAKVAKAKPPASVTKLCAQCAKESAQVDAALTALTLPRTALQEARSSRDALLPDWDKALRNFKDAAKVALREELHRWDALFARPEAVQTNVRPKPRKKPKGALAPSPTPEGAPPDMANKAAVGKRTKARKKR